MKRYLITGASRGIGRAIAETLTDSDVELLLHGRDTVALAEVCDSVKGRCARVVRLIHDLAVPSGVSNLIDQVGKNPLDLLVDIFSLAGNGVVWLLRKRGDEIFETCGHGRFVLSVRDRARQRTTLMSGPEVPAYLPAGASRPSPNARRRRDRASSTAATGAAKAGPEYRER